MGSVDEALQLPKIDLTGLEPGSPGWEAARSEVMAGLETYGCIEALYDEVSPELRDALFCRNMPELFGLPLEVKKRNTSEMPVWGYVGDIPGLAYESLLIDGAASVERAEEFTRLMWPQGNPRFRDTVCTYAKHMKNLEQKIEQMVFQSLGVEKYFDSHIKSMKHFIRLSEYGLPPDDQESKIALAAHADASFVTVISQHHVEGLEIQTREEEWIPVVPSPNSFTVMIGETFEVWCNGRLQSPTHRVRMTSSQTRYSVLLFSHPGDGYLIKAPEELVDEEHPLLYKPLDFKNYMMFRFSDRYIADKSLKSFCGARGEEEQA